MLIHFWVHTATLNASVTREEACEICGAGFVYSVQCAGSGAMVSPTHMDLVGTGEIAESIASASLGRKMKHARELVRCPNCLQYQPSLISAKRGRILLGVLIAGALPIFLAGVMLSIAYDLPSYAPHRPVALLSFAGVLAAVAAVAVLYPMYYDPNKNRFSPLGKPPEVVGMPLETWQAEKAARRAALGIQPEPTPSLGPDDRTPEQKRAEAKARRDAEMERISRQARDQY